MGKKTTYTYTKETILTCEINSYIIDSWLVNCILSITSAEYKNNRKADSDASAATKHVQQRWQNLTTFVTLSSQLEFWLRNS